MVGGLRRAAGRALCSRIGEREIKREAWALGGRHQGEVLTGARLEAATPGLSFQRLMLLQAVIRSEGRAAKPNGVKP